MNLLTKFSLKNSVAIVILCMLVLGFGFYSSTQIKQQTFPDVSFPAVFLWRGSQASFLIRKVWKRFYFYFVVFIA